MLKELVYIPIESLSMGYGAGLFETLLYDGAQIQYLDRHLTRLRLSMSFFGFTEGVWTFEPIIQQLLNVNELSDKCARINIYYIMVGPDSSPHVYITVTEYSGAQKKPYSLQISPLMHTSFMNVHKSLNYWPYKYIKSKAKQAGFDDAILVDACDYCLETTTACLVFEIDSQLYTPVQSYQLPSITLQIFTEHVLIKALSVDVEMLTKIKHVYILNSLIGIQPVSQIDTYAFEINRDFCNQWNQQLF